jgi:hypothetical protein
VCRGGSGCYHRPMRPVFDDVPPGIPAIVFASLMLLVSLLVFLPVLRFVLIPAWRHVRRAMVTRYGAPADATILSVRIEPILVGEAQILDVAELYWIVYEVRPPEKPSFRARGCEKMDSLQSKANRIAEGSSVRVRFSSNGKVVVLERVPSDDWGQVAIRKKAEERKREEDLLHGKK